MPLENIFSDMKLTSLSWITNCNLVESLEVIAMKYFDPNKQLADITKLLRLMVKPLRQKTGVICIESGIS